MGQPGSTVFFLFFFVLELFSEGRGATPLLRRSACGAGFFAGPDGGGGVRGARRPGFRVPERGGTLLRAVRQRWGSQTELLREENSQAGPGGGPSPAHAA